MFHNASTIWRKPQKTNPFSIKERRVIYGVKDFFKGIYSGAEVATRPARGVLGILATPLTASSKWTLGVVKKGYQYGVRPLANGTSWVLGSAYEAALGLKDTTAVPAFTVGGVAPIRNVKMNLYDLPIQTFRSTIAFPGHAIRAPFRSLKGVYEAITDIPDLTRNAIGNLFQNSDTMLNNIMSLKPKETVESLIALGRDTVRDTLVNPAKSFLKPLTNPFGPIAKDQYDAGKIIVDSKTQYIGSMHVAAGQVRDGLRRIWNSPGHHLNYKPLELLRGKKHHEEFGSTISKTEAATRQDEKTTGGKGKLIDLGKARAAKAADEAEKTAEGEAMQKAA